MTRLAALWSNISQRFTNPLRRWFPPSREVKEGQDKSSKSAPLPDTNYPLY